MRIDQIFDGVIVVNERGCQSCACCEQAKAREDGQSQQTHDLNARPGLCQVDQPYPAGNGHQDGKQESAGGLQLLQLASLGGTQSTQQGTQGTSQTEKEHAQLSQD